MKRISTLAVLALLTVAGAALAQVTLDRKFTPGTYKEETTEGFVQTLKIAGMEVVTRVTATSTETVTVSPRDASGQLRISRRTDGFRANLDVAGQVKVEFDSSKPDAAAQDPLGIVQVWKSLVGTTVTAVLDRDNKVIRVEGGDAIAAKLQGPLAESVKEGFKQENLIRGVRQGLQVLPDGPVKTGDRWKRSERKDIGSGQYLDLEIYYEYQGQVERDGRKLDKIGVFIDSVKYGATPNPASPLSVKASELKVTASSGTVWFDREKGTVVEKVLSTRVGGDLTLEVMGMEFPSTLDLQIDERVVMK